MIVLNKTDRLGTKARERLEAILHTLNPRADIVLAQLGRIDLARVPGTGRFSFEEARRARGWLKELRGDRGVWDLQPRVSCDATVSPSPVGWRGLDDPIGPWGIRPDQSADHRSTSLV